MSSLPVVTQKIVLPALFHCGIPLTDSQNIFQHVPTTCSMQKGSAEISQNQRMFDVGSDLSRSSCSIPLLKQDHLEPVAPNRV